MKKKILYTLISILLISCKKEVDKKDDVVPNVETFDNFQPQTNGSYWIYRNDSTKTADLDTLIATDADTLVSGNIYKIFTNGTSNKQYFRKSNGNYYQYNFASTLAGVDDSIKTKIGGINSFELLYLKDNLKLGDTWNNEFKNTYYKYKIEFTVTELLSSKKINEVTYNNVTGVKMQVYQGLILIDIPLGGFEYTPLPGAVPVTTYYAKNIGAIRTESPLKKPMNLYKYQIK